MYVIFGRVKKDWDHFVYVIMTLITYDVWWAVFRSVVIPLTLLASCSIGLV